MKLSPTKQNTNKKPIFGFDIETYGNKNDFLMATVVSPSGESFYFEDKKECVDFFKTKRFKNSIVAATNLSFDFFGTFYGLDEVKEFNTLFRGSSLVFAKSYIKNKQFNNKFKNNSKLICFLDTMNYAQLSVDNLGKILKIKKLKESVKDIIGNRPKTSDEWDILKRYNERDALISQKAIKFFFDKFHDLGATPKLTIASTAMSLFKNRFLDGVYWRHDVATLLKQFKGYYGGNTHAYNRGKISNRWYYDVNSEYPSVMREEYPDPNTLRRTRKDSDYYIHEFEGMSDVTVECPYMRYPLLPYRYNDKLLMPIGTFRGWYTHVELREAVELGYTINKVHESLYYVDTFRPFEKYVNELYDLRIRYKEENNPMELVVKLLLNSLYGKFGQKFLDRDNWIPFPQTLDEISKYPNIERFGEFARIKKDFQEPASFCIPVWAAYTTARGRILLHRYIRKSQPDYVDTDSLITKRKMMSSYKLGKLKCEGYIKRGVIVKPKFYMIETQDRTEYKVKGVGTRVGREIFMELLKSGTVSYKKFVKFKEAMRRRFGINEIIEMTKNLTLEDDKREWNAPFNSDIFQMSEPKYLNINTLSLTHEADIVSEVR